MTEEYDPLTEDLIEQLFARRAYRWVHAISQTPKADGLVQDVLCQKSALALQAQAAEIARLRAALTAIRFQCDADANGGEWTISIAVVMNLVDTAQPSKGASMTVKIGYEQGYQQGKAEAAEWMKARDDALAELSAEIAALRAENARLQADGIHSCHDGCTRSGCVNARLRACMDQARTALFRAGRTTTDIDVLSECESVVAAIDAAMGTTRNVTALESLRAWNAETDPDVASALDDLTKSRGAT